MTGSGLLHVFVRTHHRLAGVIGLPVGEIVNDDKGGVAHESS
jgi:hypothetical protein